MTKFTNTDVMTFNTLGELMRDSVRKFGERPLWGVKTNGKYEWMTYAEFGSLVRKFRAILKNDGLKKGDRVGVISCNSVEFAMTLYAAYGLGAVIIPMYEVQKFQDWEFIFSDAQPTMVVVGNDGIREKIETIECSSLKKIYVNRATNPSECLLEIVKNASEELEIDETITKDDMSDIIYTSGTTGRPRGVELTHGSVAENVRVTIEAFDIRETDRTMAFLPWAHAFGKTVELHLFPAAGAAIGLVESNRTIAQNLPEVNPTILISVPQIFNKIYDTVHHKMDQKLITRMLFGHTENIMKKNKAGTLSPIGKIQFGVLDRLIASRVRAAFGDSLRFCISGGASLSREIATFFKAFGVQVYEGYGMTEHSPVVSVNNTEYCEIGSVGVPLRGVKVDIVHDNDMLDKSDEKCGEIVLSGPCVMKGYHNDPEATRAVIDEQGRLHTGDMGYLDERGGLWITGRVKEQYKLENGKYVVPTALEEKINNSTIISNAVVFGAGKPNNVVLIVPAPEFIDEFKKANNLEGVSNEELSQNSKLRERIDKELQTACAEFRGYEKPKEFAIILEEFSIQSGLLTPALKIRRREIEKRFADVLNKLYQK